MKSFAKPPFRCSTAKSQVAVAKLLSIAGPNWADQDWEICSADAARTEEFLKIYEESDELTADEKFTLMEITIASLDDLLSEGGPGELLAEQIEKLLNRDFDIHAFGVHYWCLWDLGTSPPEDEMFSVTPMMREIWLSCN